MISLCLVYTLYAVFCQIFMIAILKENLKAELIRRSTIPETLRIHRDYYAPRVLRIAGLILTNYAAFRILFSALKGVGFLKDSDDTDNALSQEGVLSKTDSVADQLLEVNNKTATTNKLSTTSIVTGKREF